MQGKLIHYASFSGCRGLVFRVFYLKTQYFRPGSFNITLGELFTFLDILKGLKTLDSYCRGESHGLGHQCPLQSGHSFSSPSHSSCPLSSGKTPVAVKNVESKCRRQNGLLLAFKKEEERHAAVEVGGRGGSGVWSWGRVKISRYGRSCSQWRDEFNTEPEPQSLGQKGVAVETGERVVSGGEKAAEGISLD